MANPEGGVRTVSSPVPLDSVCPGFILVARRPGWAVHPRIPGPTGKKVLMSVESTEALERSVLEGKDREQLLAIAAALGVKATSRAKKADIIAKILEQTGGPSAAESPAPARAPRARNGNGDGRAKETVAVPAPALELE